MSALWLWLVFLLAALVVVPLGRRFGLSSVLGYLFAGVLIGPHGLGVVDDAAGTLEFAELGVVLLLFIIGLELQPRRLWVMRRLVFGLGTAQVLVVSLGAAFALHLVFALPALGALLLGFALSLSSTAFVLQLLGEQKQLNAAHGRAAFGVLLLQDLAVIPVIALVNLAAPHAGEGAAHGGVWGPFLFMFALTLARLLLRPALRRIAATGIHELFTAAALAIVLGAALATEWVGLSMGFGAFVAGMLVADSEYRHQLETDVTPFKGLLLGLFFMAVGMSVDLSLLARAPLQILGLALALMALKAALVFPLARLSGLGGAAAARLAVTIAQGGEFAFVLLTTAVSAALLPDDVAQQWVLAVTLTMALTPAALWLLERLLGPRGPQREFDTIAPHEDPVVLLGFGRFAQIVARVLTMRRIPFTALDASASNIDIVRGFGNTVYYGDPTRLDLLRTAHVEHARLVVLAVDDPEATLRIAELLRTHFPDVPVFARAHDRFNEIRLRMLGVQYVVREMLHSSLRLTEAVLQGLGVPEQEARASVATFEAHDRRTLRRQMAVFQDEQAYRQAARDAELELQQLFDDDAARAAARPDAPDPQGARGGDAAPG